MRHQECKSRCDINVDLENQEADENFDLVPHLGGPCVPDYLPFRSFNQNVRNLARALLELNKPTGSIVLVYLTEHEDSMVATWACILAGYIPCLQPPLSSQQARKQAHIAHITRVTGSTTWLTSEEGADQIKSIPGLNIHLLSAIRIASEAYCVPFDWISRPVQPDDEAIFFLTSGSSGLSKVVVHTHRTILAGQVRPLGRRCGVACRVCQGV